MANVWQQAIELTSRVFQVATGLNLPRGNHWPNVVAVSLWQVNERLDSIRTLLNKGYYDSAVVLTRSLFEFAVNLVYISKDTKRRLPQYLRHGRVPLTGEEAQQLQQQLEQGHSRDVRDIVPGQPWKNLKHMCCDLGSNWLKEYETFYRYASVPTHAGSLTFGTNYKRLLDQQSPSDYEKAGVLVSALEFHLRVVEIAAQIFPEQISSGIVNDLKSDCQKLGQFLVRGV